jgi:hypothetical protein
VPRPYRRRESDLTIVVTFQDWLELLGLDDTVADLLAGRTAIGVARAEAEAARSSWPGLAHDHVSVLDQLGPFFDEVSDVIDAQAEAVAAFNRSIAGFGPTFDHDGERLLTDADIEAMLDIRDSVLAQLAGLRSSAEAIADEIRSLFDEIAGLTSGLDEGDPFAAEEYQELTEELDELFSAIDGEGCLPS